MLLPSTILSLRQLPSYKGYIKPLPYTIPTSLLAAYPHGSCHHKLRFQINNALDTLSIGKGRWFSLSKSLYLMFLSNCICKLPSSNSLNWLATHLHRIHRWSCQTVGHISTLNICFKSENIFSRLESASLNHQARILFLFLFK